MATKCDVHLKYYDSVFCKIDCDAGIFMEISEHFTFYAENYRYHPKYKNKVWDGKIRLANRMTGLIYAGLAKRVKKFCESRDYTFSFDNELSYDRVYPEELQKFISSLGLPEHFELREYQFDSILKCIQTKRRTLVSPTSSGKSLMIYILMRWYMDQEHKALLIVPTINLVLQMESDFRSYGFEGKIHTSTDGISKSKNIDTDVVITTWQSLDNGKTKLPKAWYPQFGVVFGDEAHGCKADTLKRIMSHMTDTVYRFGTTGTLDKVTLNQMTIEGLFGPQFRAVTTKELMKQGYVTKLQIKCIVLKYPPEIAAQLKTADYHEELQFLIHNKTRTAYIKKLALSQPGNKIVFFRMKDHGTIIRDTLQDSGKKIYYIDGNISGEERENIRLAIENETDAIIVASVGTTSTGVSINKLHRMIAASPMKSLIKVLQSIGRLLRLHKDKDEAVFYDIVDDLTYKSRKNFTLKHFEERLKIYEAEGFDYKIYNVTLK